MNIYKHPLWFDDPLKSEHSYHYMTYPGSNVSNSADGGNAAPDANITAIGNMYTAAFENEDYSEVRYNAGDDAISNGVEYALIIGDNAWISNYYAPLAGFTYRDVYLSKYGIHFLPEGETANTDILIDNGVTYYRTKNSTSVTMHKTLAHKDKDGNLLYYSKEIDTENVTIYKYSTNIDDWVGYEDYFNQELSEDDPSAYVDRLQLEINKKMQEFVDMMLLIEDKFVNHKAIYTPYVYFKLGDKVIVDTSSQEWIENCLVQLEHKQSGTQSANEFNLKILFAPNLRNYIAINELENKLLQLLDITADENNTTLKDSTGNELDYHMNCEFTYGYGDDENIRSVNYSGLVIDYDSDINSGLFQYTIKGVCSIYADKETRITIKPEHYTDENGNEITNSLQFLQRFFDIEYGEGSTNEGMYELKFMDNITEEEYTYNGGSFSNITQKNIFQLIDDVLASTSGAVEIEKTNANKELYPTQKTIFGYYVDSKKDPEKPNKLATINIYKQKTKHNAADEIADSTAALQFNWFSADTNVGVNHLVKKWNPKYSGSVAISLANIALKNGIHYPVLLDDGKVGKRIGMGGARVGGSAVLRKDQLAMSMQEYTNWALGSQMTTTADLVIQGCPYDPPLTGLIRISALMGQGDTIEHHSSGIYQIEGKTDVISSNGFESTIKLFKLVAPYNPDTGKMDEDFKAISGVQIREVTLVDLLSSRYGLTVDDLTQYMINDEVIFENPNEKLNDAYLEGKGIDPSSVSILSGIYQEGSDNANKFQLYIKNSEFNSLDETETKFIKELYDIK